MFRRFALSLKAFAAVAALMTVLTHYASAAGETHKVIARIYEGNQMIAEVIEIGELLGTGGFGDIRQVKIRNSKGTERTVALKFFHAKHSSTFQEKILPRWSQLDPVYEADTENVLAYSATDLKLVFEGDKAKARMHVMLSDIATGSALDLIEKIPLKANDSRLEAKLGIIAKFKNQVLKGIDLLASHGLAHGDIKPANVLYFAKRGFDENHPDASKIQFRITDFDTLTAVNQPLPHIDPFTGAPEAWRRININATPAYDLYSHATAVYTMTFDKAPLIAYIESPAAKDLREEAWMALRDEKRFQKEGPEWIKQALIKNPSRYETYLRWINQRFQTLDQPGLSKDARAKLDDIRQFVLNGLRLSPEERLKAFPNIRASLRLSRCPDLISKLELLLKHP